MTRLINRALLDELTAEAKANPRLRKNRNFHRADDDPAHRLLNAAEPGSYIAPHRHLDPRKDESLFILRGCMGLVTFDDAGVIVKTALLSAAGECCGVDIPHGEWHTFVALEAGTVIFEAKAGPYLPLAAAERAPWAPAENDANAGEYLARLERIFSGLAPT